MIAALAGPHSGRGQPLRLRVCDHFSGEAIRRLHLQLFTVGPKGPHQKRPYVNTYGPTAWASRWPTLDHKPWASPGVGIARPFGAGVQP